MALLWCDGFDHYGAGASGRSAMLDGVWAEVDGNVEPSATNPRTGGRSLRNPGGASVRTVRRVFGADKAVVGFGYALYLDNLPTAASDVVLAQFRDNANTSQVTLNLTTTGQIEARTGTAIGSIIGTSGVAVTAAAYQHFECRVAIDSAAGAVEVRVNGVTVLDLSNVDTRGAGTAQTAQVRIGGGDGSGTAPVTYYDDLYAWDDQGSVANDFLGDQRVFMLLPDANTAEADWTPVGAGSPPSGFAAIAEDTPDDDTSYISGAAPAGSPPVGPVSVFGLEDLPASVSAVTAVQMVGRMRKTDAGACDVQMSLLSSNVGSPPAPAEANGADRPITEVYTYWQDVFHTDPATGAAWTPAAVDAARFKIERTA